MNTKRTHVRILSLLLCLSMILGMAPMMQLFTPAAAADPEQETAKGSCTADHSAYTELGTANAAAPVAVEASALAAGGNFKLVSDIVLNGTVNLKVSAETREAVHLHIDLNGFAIKVAPASPVANLVYMAGQVKVAAEGENPEKPAAYAEFTLCDGVGTGKLDGTGLTGAIVSLSSCSTFNLYGGTITGAKVTGNGGGIYINSGTATVNMKGGAVSGNTAAQGAGIYRQAGALNLEGGVISNNTANTKAGAIWINSGTFTMKGGKITGNQSKGKAGGIYGAGATTINIEGGEISGNIAADQGGGINIGGNKATLNVKGGEIINNKGKNGGAFSVDTGTSVVNISGGKISGNIGTDNGSVLLSNGCVLNITGGEITGNKTKAKTIAVSGATVTMSGGKISGNTNLDGTAVVAVQINNYGKTSTATFTGTAVVEDPVEFAAARAATSTAAAIPEATGKVENLVLGASILVATASKTRVTVDAADESVIETKTDAGYVYTGSVNWEKISGTINALPEGHYKLTGDANLSAALTITGEVVIDLNGHTLTGVAVPFITVPTGAKLTVKDSATGGKIQGLDSATDVMVLVTGGEFVLESGIMTGHTQTSSKDGGAVRVEDGKFTMNGGAITGNTISSRWGAVYVGKGVVEINDGEITNNKAGRGGALCARKNTASIVINGGKISGNTAQYGGAIYFLDTANLTINGGEISNNKADHATAKAQGGAIFGGGTLTITGGLITGNDAKSGSPAVHATGTVFTMTGGTIKDNGTAEPASNIIKQGTPALDSTTVISGNPVIEGQAINIVGSYTIENLTEGAYIYSQTEAGTTDKSVAVTNVSGKFLYTDAYKADTQWDFFEDDFEDYTAGENAFKDQMNADFYSGIQYTAGSHSYDIVKEGENTFLKLFHQNAAGASTVKNYFLYSHSISGEYTMTFDFRPETAGGGWVINMLQGYTFATGKPILVYINTNGGAYIHDQATKGTNEGDIIRVKDANDQIIIPQVGSWYSVKITLENGKMTLKMWEKGAAEPVEGAGVAVCETAVFDEAAISAGKSIRFQTRSAAGAALAVSLDNLKLFKIFGAENPETVIAEVGDKLEAAPFYTVNDLSATKPYPTYKYTTSDPSLVVDGICKAEGVAELTIELLNVKGEPTGITYTTQLVIGNSYGISIGDDIQVSESDIGKTHQLTATPNADVTLPEGYTVQWTTEDPSVVTVDANGKLTYVAFGNADITAQVLDKNGKATLYYAKINVQVGETPLRVLSIGNSFSRDSLYYISSLAEIYDLRVEAAYLMKSSATIRQHAQNLANRTADYSWYTTNAVTGEMLYKEGSVTINQKVESQDWDIIILHQGVKEAGFPGTYSEDLRYLLDYIADVQPNAKVYWNMTWALQEGFASGTHGTAFQKHYKGNQELQYNAFVDTLDEFIAGEDAVFGADFDGWFPTGVAIQNLRETIDHDKDLTRDGFHLSLDIGRLTAAMTLLKTMEPDLDLSKITAEEVAKFIVTNKKDLNGFTGTELDTDESTYTYSAADLPKIIAAVEAACASDKVPAKKEVSKTDTSAVTEKYEGSVIMGQENLPLLMHFPDTKVTSDGTVWSCAYVNVAHYPDTQSNNATNPMWQGVGELVIWTGTQDYTTAQWQESYENPALVITQELLEKWGCTKISGRYELLQANPAAGYTVMADPRDGNFGVVTTDIDGDGDKEEAVLFTFWIRYYDQNGGQTAHRQFMTWAVQDANGKWVWKDGCQELKAAAISGSVVKRGDITAFSDGTILIPLYGGSVGVPADATYAAASAYAMYMKFDTTKGEWVEIYSYDIPNFDKDESATHNEISLVVPDPDSDTVYAFTREPGSVLVSYDRAQHWEYLANEPGICQQPGFTVLDEERVFVTWAMSPQPRPTYGKVFYVNSDWFESETHMIYQPGTPHNSAGKDAADPSCALLPNGKVLIISYDTSYQAIVGVVEDPNDEKYQAIELREDEDITYIIYENDEDTALTESNAIPENVKPYGSYTIEAQIRIDEENGAVSFGTSAGALVVTAEAGKTVNVILKVIDDQVYAKAWEEGKEEPAEWEIFSDLEEPTEQPVIIGDGATLLDVTVSDRMMIELQDIATLTVGDPSIVLSYSVQPASANVTFKSSDDEIVLVDETGKITAVGAGKATITMIVNGYAEKTCTVVVLPQPAELTGTGTTNTILWDDYEEDKYTAGDNALWNHYWADPSKSFYIVQNAVGMTSASTGVGKYNIIAEGDNQYLELKEPTTWLASAAEITGNYTVSFDVLFTGTGRSLNLTMWQNELVEVGPDGKEVKTKGNEIHAFVNLQANKSRYQFRAKSLFVDSSTSTNPNLYCNGDNTLVDSTKYDTTNGAANVWQCVRMSRIDGGLYLKVWNKYAEDGSIAAEPEQWTCVLNHKVLDADVPSHFRMQFDCGTTGQSVYVDNLKITQQTPETLKVTFKDGAETLSEQAVEIGRLASKPADPTKEGYTFIGWYNGDTAWDFATEPVNEAITLTAKFEVNKYTVTIDGVEQTVEHGSKLTKPADPTKEGYTFAGWYNGDEKWDFENDTVTGNMELTAKWEAVQSGGSGSGSDEPSKTGDRAMPMAFALLVMLSVCGLAVVVIGKKKLF